MPTTLHKEIDNLKEIVYSQRMQVENAIAGAFTALLENQPELARSVIDSDDNIDALEVRIEEECLRILTLHQPVAIDFRFVVAVLKVNNDLERMGDYAVNIAKRSKILLGYPEQGLTFNLSTMADRVKSMVKRSLDAFFKSDGQLALQVRKDDSEVDSMRRFFNESIKEEIQKNPHQIDYLLELSSLVRHFERLADMATHVAEEVIYLVEGRVIRHANKVGKK